MHFIKIILLALLMPLAVLAQKNKKSEAIAYVEERLLLKALVGYEKNTKALDSLKLVYDQENASAKKELEKKVSDLLVNYAFSTYESIESIQAKLKPADADKLALYTKESELLTKANDNYKLVLKTIYEQKVQPLLDKLNSILANYAKAHDIKMIYTFEKIAPSLAYLNKGIDITPEILKLL